MTSIQTIIADYLAAHDTATNDEAAAALNVPIHTPRRDRVTFSTLGAIWGASRAAAFYVALRSLSEAGHPLAAYVFGLLSGTGFDATNPDAAPVAGQLSAAGLCSADEATLALNERRYVVGRVVTAEEVAATRALAERAAAMDAVAARVNAVAAAFLNDRINVARADDAADLPTYEEFAAAVAQQVN